VDAEADGADADAELVLALESGVVRGVSLNWNVMLSFASNQRGFGSGSIIDCRTLLIPWEPRPEGYLGFGDAKSCSTIPEASEKRDDVSLSEDV